VSFHLEVISDETLLEVGSCRVLDGEVPATEDLKAYIRAVTLSDHPSVLVADSCSVRGVQM